MIGFDWIGLDWIGLDWIGLDKVKMTTLQVLSIMLMVHFLTKMNNLEGMNSIVKDSPWLLDP